MTYARSATYPGSHPTDTDWYERMNCAGEDPALFEYTATEEQQAQAEEICLTCPVFVACGEDAKARTAAAGTTRGAVKVRGYFAGVMYLGEAPKRKGRPPEPGTRRRVRTSRSKLTGEQIPCANPECDEFFVRHAKSGKQRCCSERCADRVRYVRNHPGAQGPRVCLYRKCDALVTSNDPRSRYCCSAHRTREQYRRAHPLEPRVCAYGPCGREFEASQSNRVFCRRECRWAAASRRRAGRTEIPVPLRDRPIVTCALAGCEARFPQGGATGRRRFCTTQHQQAAYHDARHTRRRAA